MGCFWYFSARITDFPPDSWVSRLNLLDKPRFTQYLSAISWAISTATTVGYGEITPVTELEVLICVCWMVVGVGFYSYTVGSLSSVLMSIDTRDSTLGDKLMAVQELTRQTGISQGIKDKIREAIKFNAWKSGNIWKDKYALFNELPKPLQYEVAWSIYDKAALHFPVFRKFETGILVKMMPLMRPVRMNKGEFAYKEGSYPDLVYFVTLGRVGFVLLPSEVLYKSFVKGSYFGEVDILTQSNRQDHSLCLTSCEFLVLSKFDFLKILDDFPSDAKKIHKIAKEKGIRTSRARSEVLFLLQLKLKGGTLQQIPEENEENEGKTRNLEERMGKIEKVVKKQNREIESLKENIEETAELIEKIVRVCDDFNKN